MEKRKGMSETNKMMLESSPDLKEYYNPEKDEIEFWRMAKDEEKEKRGN